MNYKYKAILISLITFIFVSSMLIIAVRGELLKSPISQNDDGGEEFTEPALVLVYLAFIYVAMYRVNIHRKLIFQGTNNKYRKIIKENYKKIRRPLLFSHSILNLAATLLATFHGLYYLDKDWDVQYLTGFIALVSMIILSLSGLVIYLRNNPLWNNKNSRKILRSFHKQWLITSILIASLLLHTSLG